MQQTRVFFLVDFPRRPPTIQKVSYTDLSDRHSGLKS